MSDDEAIDPGVVLWPKPDRRQAGITAAPGAQFLEAEHRRLLEQTAALELEHARLVADPGNAPGHRAHLHHLDVQIADLKRHAKHLLAACERAAAARRRNK